MRTVGGGGIAPPSAIAIGEDYPTQHTPITDARLAVRLRKVRLKTRHLRQSGRPLNLFVTAGQVSDYIGARALMSSLPAVDWLLADRGYDADWFRDALKDKGIRACIPGRKQRTKPVKYGKRRYKRRNRPSRDLAAQDTAGQ